MTSVFDASGLAPRHGAPQTAIDSAERALTVTFPRDYRLFLSQSNGLEGPIGDSGYLMMFAAEELVDVNEAAETSHFAPGFVIIGSDGSGRSYGFIARDKGHEYAQVWDMELSLDELEPMGGSLVEMVISLHG